MSSRETQETLEQFGSCWEGLEDPRTSNATLYDFHEMLVIALCCVLCGGQGPSDMALFAELKEPFLRGFLSLKHGVPKHDAFSRLFRALDPDQFRDAFQRFMAQFSEQVQGVVAVDGKVLRRSFDRASGKSALHMVSAWGSEQRLVLAQVATDAKSNEITAVPKLLKMLTLKGTIVTADALNCQRTIAAQIVEQEGDYALALKGNQGTLHEDVVLLVDDPETKSATAQPVVEADHGRIETRTATVSTEIDWLQKQHQWPGLKAVGKVVRMRETAEKTTTETAYYLLSAAHSRAAQRGCPPALGRGKQPALSLGCGDERRPGQDANGKRARESRHPASHGNQRHAERGLQRVAARKVQTRQLERRLPLSAFDVILKSDSPGIRPGFSPHATKESSRRGPKSDAPCSPSPATTGKNLKRSANGPISHGSQLLPAALRSFP
jgi:predicted transposase YbfD/YdcC